MAREVDMPWPGGSERGELHFAVSALMARGKGAVTLAHTITLYCPDRHVLERKAVEPGHAQMHTM